MNSTIIIIAVWYCVQWKLKPLSQLYLRCPHFWCVVYTFRTKLSEP